MDKNSKETPQYQQLANKPIACSFCAAEVRGQVRENYNSLTKQTEKIIHWNCTRCGNVIRRGRI